MEAAALANLYNLGDGFARLYSGKVPHGRHRTGAADSTGAAAPSGPRARTRAARGGPARGCSRPARSRWVHSSDLADPTPFLSEDLALLTTGTQFDRAIDIDTYVGRLADRGVLGLGFGTEVHRSGIPEEARRLVRPHTGMPLFAVPVSHAVHRCGRAHSEGDRRSGVRPAIVGARHPARPSPSQLSAPAGSRRPSRNSDDASTSGRGCSMPRARSSPPTPRDRLHAEMLDALSGRVMEILTRGLEASQSLTPSASTRSCCSPWAAEGICEG